MRTRLRVLDAPGEMRDLIGLFVLVMKQEKSCIFMGEMACGGSHVYTQN